MQTTTTSNVRPLGEVSRAPLRQEVHAVSRTPIPAPRGITFLIRDIPVQADYPQAHEEITNLLCFRQQYREDMEEALVDSDQVRHGEAQQFYWECNERMHLIARNASGGDQTHLSPSSTKRTTTTAASSSEKYVDVDDLPNSSTYKRTSSTNNHAVGGQEQQDHLEMQRRELQNSQRVYAGSPGPVSFRIWLVFLEGSISRTVWDSMPISNIYDFACEWLQTDYAFRGSVEDVGLHFHRRDGTDLMLPVRGVVFDIPLNKDDILEVRTNENGRAPLPRPH